MKYDRILLDVETQRDFFHASGSLYNEHSSAAIANVYHLFDWARQGHIPIISTVLRVRPFDQGPMGDVPHCVDGTEGEKKMPRTILPKRLNLGLLNTTDLPADIFESHQQIILEKRETDIFAHARAERMITEMDRSTTFVVCGAGVAQGIVQAVVGLRSRGFRVIVANDAILDFDHAAAEMAYLRMEAKGAIFAPTAEIVAPAKARAPAKFRTAKTRATAKKK